MKVYFVEMEYGTWMGFEPRAFLARESALKHAIDSCYRYAGKDGRVYTNREGAVVVLYNYAERAKRVAVELRVTSYEVEHE